MEVELGDWQMFSIIGCYNLGDWDISLGWEIF